MPHRWDTSARLRREQIEKGLDLTFSRVFVPWYQDLLKKHGCRTVLEVGAGTGHLALSLRSVAEHVTVIEPSLGMFENALEVLANSDVVLRNLRAEDLEQDRYYDAVISHMCVQTVDDATSFLRAMALHVAPRGILVVSLPHPCFYNEYKKLIPAPEYRYMEHAFREVAFAISLDQDHPITGVPYYHRPLSAYVAAVSRAGFLLESLNEIFPSSEIQQMYPSPWKDPRYIVLAARRA